MLWDWSFFMAAFSMIGSAPTRLLQHLPETDQKDYDGDKIERASNLFLQRVSKSTKGEKRNISRRMLWVWQCPAMLMSYSWVLFLVGFTLHILTPTFNKPQAQASWKVCEDHVSYPRLSANLLSGFCYHCVRLWTDCSQLHLLRGDVSVPSSRKTFT